MHMGVRARDLFEVYILVYLLLTLDAHVPEGYGSCPVCLSATLIWGLGLVEV